MTADTSFGAAAERELLELICAVREQSLSAAQTSRLEELILNSPAARRIYVNFVDMHAGLRWCASAPADFLLPMNLPAPPAQRSPETADGAHLSAVHSFLKSSPLLSAAWLTSPRVLTMVVGGGLVGYFAVLALSIAITRIAWDSKHPHGAVRPTADASLSAGRPGTEIGTLNAGPHARWAPAAVSSENVARIGQRYELSSGRAELVLTGGTRVMVEGPATWQIASAKRLLLDSGKLSAHVPKAAVGFTVATPTAEVIDLGTDFGVVVTDSSETRLAVFKGVVQVMVLGEPAAGPMPLATVAAARKRASLAPIRVSAGQAVSVSRGTSGASVAETVPFKTVWTDALARLSDPLVTASSSVIVHQITPAGAPGQIGFFGAVHGFDFDVARPICVTRLGVFDHLGDGIDSESSFTLQLWSRDDRGNKYRPDDTGIAVLGEATLTAEAPGELRFGHRFATLEPPVMLQPGSYSVVAYGYSPRNPLLQPSTAPGVRVDVFTSRHAIVPIGWRGQKDVRPGTLPANPQNDDHAGVTLEFDEE